MQDQPRYEVYEANTFFENGQASRPLVEGTIARGHLQEDTYFYTGKGRAGGDQSGNQTTNQGSGATRDAVRRARVVGQSGCAH